VLESPLRKRSTFCLKPGNATVGEKGLQQKVVFSANRWKKLAVPRGKKKKEERDIYMSKRGSANLGEVRGSDPEEAFLSPNVQRRDGQKF